MFTQIRSFAVCLALVLTACQSNSNPTSSAGGRALSDPNSDVSRGEPSGPIEANIRVSSIISNPLWNGSGTSALGHKVLPTITDPFAVATILESPICAIGKASVESYPVGSGGFADLPVGVSAERIYAEANPFETLSIESQRPVKEVLAFASEQASLILPHSDSAAINWTQTRAWMMLDSIEASRNRCSPDSRFVGRLNYGYSFFAIVSVDFPNETARERWRTEQGEKPVRSVYEAGSKSRLDPARIGELLRLYHAKLRVAIFHVGGDSGLLARDLADARCSSENIAGCRKLVSIITQIGKRFPQSVTAENIEEFAILRAISVSAYSLP